MSLFDDFNGWKNRIEASLQLATLDIRRKEQVLARLQQVHQQVQQILASGSTASTNIPWEIANGLSILGHVADANKLPTDPKELPTRLMDDGTLLGCKKWELLDPGWSEALVQWVAHLDKRNSWASTPVNLTTLPDTATIAIAGDWGTGEYIADKVTAAMNATQSDYTVHLGDVYYAGVGTDEGNDFSHWPTGTLGQFTLNSNHEMYNGAFGYFGELASAKFKDQNGTSYFSLRNSHWLILGLDSAYYSDELKLYMDGALDTGQVAWLQSQVSGWAGKIIVLSHHQGLSLDGGSYTGLYHQVVSALGREPDYWYWGHLHNVACYKVQPNSIMHGRCVGHGAIPYGPAKDLVNSPTVAWSETLNANDLPDYPLRVVNGFVQLQLTGPDITETFIDENGGVRWKG